MASVGMREMKNMKRVNMISLNANAILNGMWPMLKNGNSRRMASKPALVENSIGLTAFF